MNDENATHPSLFSSDLCLAAPAEGSQARHWAAWIIQRWWGARLHLLLPMCAARSALHIANRPALGVLQ